MRHPVLCNPSVSSPRGCNLLGFIYADVCVTCALLDLLFQKAVGVLEVKDMTTGEVMDIASCWNRFRHEQVRVYRRTVWCRCSVTGNAGDGSYRVDDVACHPPFLSQANFSSNYAVYHHLRACGWVPKAGIKFGVEFLAYRLVLHVR